MVAVDPGVMWMLTSIQAEIVKDHTTHSIQQFGHQVSLFIPIPA